MNEEFLMSLLFLVVVPLVQQGIKLLKDKTGVSFVKYQNQLVSLVLSAVFVFLSGGFAGLSLPEWSGDILAYAEGSVVVIGAAWTAIMATYEVVWDRLFVTLKVATRDKLS